LAGMTPTPNDAASSIMQRDASGNAAVNDFYTHDVVPWDGDNTYDCGIASKRWANVYCVVLHEGDHVWTERACAVCKQPFIVGQKVAYLVIAVGEEGTRAVPMHWDCRDLTNTERSL